MSEPTNAERRQRAMETLDRYGVLAGAPNEPYDDQTTDLLADLMHMHGAQWFDDCLRKARMHYETERYEAERAS